ncbi:hypothetical protein EDB92DRAFT_471043 [Lactarius akahatsu]|uniref:Uncharacterized protein n=1 Tax=Lactarius akahatsu TaxID=416441 RepID=A0AAD4LRX3_9AGAM|nr:hypothetical protein EDB92DRAFT_471043 [Lactarius akahatsu]
MITSPIITIVGNVAPACTFMVYVAFVPLAFSDVNEPPGKMNAPRRCDSGTNMLYGRYLAYIGDHFARGVVPLNFPLSLLVAVVGLQTLYWCVAQEPRISSFTITTPTPTPYYYTTPQSGTKKSD